MLLVVLASPLRSTPSDLTQALGGAQQLDDYGRVMEKPCRRSALGTIRVLTAGGQASEFRKDFLSNFCASTIWTRRSPPPRRGAGCQSLWPTGGTSLRRHGFDTF